ncbi:MAG TPA: hypothetical protein EYG73_01685 [Arcobacter sp.]|nr:hypothetical protein [Arcobacter sp.]
MRKVGSIRIKNIWLGVGIFLAFIVLQLAVSFRFSTISNEIDEYQKRSDVILTLYKVKNDLISYKYSGNDSYILNIREKLNDIGNSSLRNKILAALPSVKESDFAYKSLEGLIDKSIAKESRANEVTVDITQENVIMFIIILIINIIINYALYLFAKKIIVNIEKLQNGILSFFDFLNRKKESIEKLEIKSNDEFEQISEIINENIENIRNSVTKDKECVEEIRDVVHVMEEGDFSYRIEKEPVNPEIRNLKDSLNNLLDISQNLYSQILNVLEDYKNEHFEDRVNITAKGEIGKLIEGVNSLGLSLKESSELIAGILSQKSEVLQDTSNKLTENIDELSEIFTKTNKNIDNVTVQIDEIMQAVKSTVAKTNEMKDVANKTSSSAKVGQDFAINTLNAMQEIYTSTNDISEAISVIDSIAFQTNILSLNAAVEAATAGEAGKGFAVVAQEVRNLANKSAEAAKKIKELVSKTQDKSNEGIEITKNMKENFIDVVNNVSNTLELVNAVAEDADSEMKKIISINTLVKDIDNMIHQNKEIMQNTYVVTYDLSKISNELYEHVKRKNIVENSNG